MSTLLTTMSTLRRRNSISYYSAEIKGSRKYAAGISQQEIGTKYFLADPDAKIDRIIVLGSEQTYYNDDSLKTDDIAADPEAFRTEGTNPSGSAFSFYRWRINEYMNGLTEEENNAGNDISETRQADLKVITDNYLYGLGYNVKEEWFAKISESGNAAACFKGLSDLIRQDISRNFVNPKDYDKYANVDTFPELQAVLKEQDVIHSTEENIQEILNRINSLKHDAGLQEAYIAKASDHLEKTRDLLEQHRLDSKEAVYEATLQKLRVTIQNLIGELNALKTNRAGTEAAYAKKYIFDLMASRYKMTPVKSEQPIKMIFVPLKINGVENLNGIIDTIRQEPDAKLYIDMQGGSRTDAYVRNAVLSMLSNEGSSDIKIQKIVATDFDVRNFVNPLNNETSRYLITDLVSGMNAFIQYGRVDMISRYIHEVNLDSPRIKRLVQEMTNIDHTLSICNIDGFMKSVDRLKKIFDEKAEVGNNESDIIFSIIEGSIKRDYAILFSADRDYGKIAEWALNKHFVQQALTIIESKMPEEFVRHGILYYAKTKDERNKAVKCFTRIRDTKDENKYKLDDPNHFFIKDYFFYSGKRSKFDYLPEEVMENVKTNSGSQQSNAIKWMVNNPDKYEGLHIYTNTDVNKAIKIRDLYMPLANARNEMNHASIDIEEFCQKIRQQMRPEYEDDPNAAYRIAEVKIKEFLKEYNNVLKSMPAEPKPVYIQGPLPKNNGSGKSKKSAKKNTAAANVNSSKDNSSPSNKKTDNQSKKDSCFGTVLGVFPTYAMIRSNDTQDSPIIALLRDMDQTVSENLKMNDKVTFTVDKSGKGPKAVNVKMAN